MKTKFFTSMLIGVVLALLQPVNGQNVLVDGDFSTTTDISVYSSGLPPMNVWCAFQNEGTLSGVTVDAGVCNYMVYYGGWDTWEVQLQQYGFNLIPDHYYRLTFDVMADAERWFGVYLGEYYGSWTSLLGWENYWQYATTSWHTLSFDFYASGNFDVNQFSIEIGGYSGIGMHFDNFMLTDIGPYAPVGILGNALSGWDVDYDMFTADGIHYSLSDFPLDNGRVKFRQNNAWFINWGNNTFPTGIAYQDGPDIPIPNPGNYDINFNRETGAYTFVCADNCLPYIGIIGSAVPPGFGTDPDVNLSTSDGITYSLLFYTFTDGEAWFRQDDDNLNTWANNSFPSGTAIQGGSPIPVAAGLYNLTFNLATGAYNFIFPVIGIVGSALNGWDNDVVMFTTDGINYTLSDYVFNDGEVKFRADYNWDNNWGGYNFPSGYGISYGPNIFVPAGTYDVTFNLSTLEYTFAATTCPVPGIQCPSNVYTSTSPGMCGAEVFYPEVIPAPNCGGDGITISQTEGLPSGSFFPVGATANTFVLTNSEGNTASCSFDIYVWDGEAPVISGLSRNPATLWPPNHKMVPVTINYTAEDNCGNTNCELYVWSNEPENGLGDGDLSPDWQVIDAHHVLLRAERSGAGTGREYHILIYCMDNSWNFSYEEVIVRVPHDKGKSDESLSSAGDLNQPGFNEADASSTKFTVNVWPNPSEQSFNLKVESISGETISAEIIDITGRLISMMNIINNQETNIGDNLRAGVYFIRIRQGEFFGTVKLIKQ